MTSYMTGSEAFTREHQQMDSAPQAAWADKYRGVSLYPKLQETETAAHIIFTGHH